MTGGREEKAAKLWVLCELELTIALLKLSIKRRRAMDPKAVIASKSREDKMRIFGTSFIISKGGEFVSVVFPIGTSSAQATDETNPNASNEGIMRRGTRCFISNFSILKALFPKPHT